VPIIIPYIVKLYCPILCALVDFEENQPSKTHAQSSLTALFDPIDQAYRFALFAGPAQSVGAVVAYSSGSRLARGLVGSPENRLA
jgi:hypothetical protein